MADTLTTTIPPLRQEGEGEEEGEAVGGERATARRCVLRGGGLHWRHRCAVSRGCGCWPPRCHCRRRARAGRRHGQCPTAAAPPLPPPRLHRRPTRGGSVSFTARPHRWWRRLPRRAATLPGPSPSRRCPPRHRHHHPRQQQQLQLNAAADARGGTAAPPVTRRGHWPRLSLAAGLAGPHLLPSSPLRVVPAAGEGPAWPPFLTSHASSQGTGGDPSPRRGWLPRGRAHDRRRGHPPRPRRLRVSPRAGRARRCWRWRGWVACSFGGGMTSGA